MRLCRRCNNEKELICFNVCTSNPDGLQRCFKECNISYRQDNKKRLKQQQQLYNAQHRDERRTYMQQYHEANKDKAHARDKEWREANREKNLERLRVYWDQTGEARNEQRRAARQQDPEGMRVADRERHTQQKDDPAYQQRRKEARQRYHQNHPEQAKADWHRREARLRGVSGSFSPKEWTLLKAFYGHRCLCCGCTEQNAIERYNCGLTPDHVIPTTWEGCTNDITNIQPLCLGCNTSKGDFHETDYRTTLPPWFE